MSPATKIEELLRALDPLTEELDHRNARRCDVVWAEVLAHNAPRRSRTRRWRLIGVSSMATAAAAVALMIGLLPGTAPPGAAAAQLRNAATTNAELAALPALGSGQYYYQSSLDEMVCDFSLLPEGYDAVVHYVIGATVQSWTDGNGQGASKLTYLPVGKGGTGWQTPYDEEIYKKAGSPTNLCTSKTGQSGGSSAVVQDGQVLSAGLPAGTITTSRLVRHQSIVNLPTDAAEIAALLANGQWNPTTLSVSPTPGPCPIAGSTTSGCDTVRQLELLDAMLILPNTSAQLSTVLYQVLSQMPGVTSTPSSTDLGISGTKFSAPGSPLSIVVDRTSGTLLSTELDGLSPYVHDAVVPVTTNFGPVVVVDGVESTTPNPSSTNGYTAAVTPVPAANASHVVWVAWAARQRVAMRAYYLLSTMFPVPPTRGCTVSRPRLTPTTSTGADGIPRGLVLYAITMKVKCSLSGTNGTVRL
jgi:hypothetical protein